MCLSDLSPRSLIPVSAAFEKKRSHKDSCWNDHGSWLGVSEQRGSFLTKIYQNSQASCAYDLIFVSLLQNPSSSRWNHVTSWWTKGRCHWLCVFLWETSGTDDASLPLLWEVSFPQNMGCEAVCVILLPRRKYFVQQVVLAITAGLCLFDCYMPLPLEDWTMWHSGKNWEGS